jgi:hypothetical protein
MRRTTGVARLALSSAKTSAGGSTPSTPAAAAGVHPVTAASMAVGV